MDLGLEDYPFFSVVIPLYNKADTIERAIRSVAAQTYRDYELIVVNDGSTDGSLRVVTDLAKDISMVIHNKNNGGVSSARNVGARIAIGKYIALLDGDDVWYPTHLEVVARAIRNHPSIKFFGCGYEWVCDKYIYYTIPWGGEKVGDVFDLYRYAQPIHTSSAVIERCLWLSVGGFNEGYSYYEDHEFFLRLGLYTKCCVIQKITERYETDARDRATKEGRLISREARPHLVFIDNAIADGRATNSMIKYACTQARLIHALICCGILNVSFRSLKSDFPNIVGLLPHLFEPSDTRVMDRVRGRLFLLYYRLRNHLVMWRRKR